MDNLIKISLLISLLSASTLTCFAAEDEVVVRGGAGIAKRKQISAPQAGSMDELSRGLDKYDKGDFKGALSDLNKAILKDPQNSQAYMFRGLVRENMGDYINAISDFEQNRIAAYDPIFFSEKGFCQTQMYELPTALANLNKSIALDHTSVDAATALARRATVKRLIHNSSGAINDCNQALQLVPDHLEATWQRAVTYCAMRQLPAAITDLQRVVRAAPRFANGHFTLAECLRATGRSKDALTEYQTAANLFAEQNDDHGKQIALKRITELSSNRDSS